MKVAILYPFSESSRSLCSKLLETGYDVNFYCPERVDLDLAQNMIFEMNIIGKQFSFLTFYASDRIPQEKNRANYVKERTVLVLTLTLVIVRY